MYQGGQLNRSEITALSVLQHSVQFVEERDRIMLDWAAAPAHGAIYLTR